MLVPLFLGYALYCRTLVSGTASPIDAYHVGLLQVSNTTEPSSNITESSVLNSNVSESSSPIATSTTDSLTEEPTLAPPPVVTPAPTPSGPTPVVTNAPTPFPTATPPSPSPTFAPVPAPGVDETPPDVPEPSREVLWPSSVNSAPEITVLVGTTLLLRADFLDDIPSDAWLTGKREYDSCTDICSSSSTQLLQVDQAFATYYVGDEPDTLYVVSSLYASKNSDNQTSSNGTEVCGGVDEEYTRCQQGQRLRINVAEVLPSTSRTTRPLTTTEMLFTPAPTPEQKAGSSPTNTEALLDNRMLLWVILLILSALLVFILAGFGYYVLRKRRQSLVPAKMGYAMDTPEHDDVLAPKILRDPHVASSEYEAPSRSIEPTWSMDVNESRGETTEWIEETDFERPESSSTTFNSFHPPPPFKRAHSVSNTLSHAAMTKGNPKYEAETSQSGLSSDSLRKPVVILGNRRIKSRRGIRRASAPKIVSTISPSSKMGTTTKLKSPSLDASTPASDGFTDVDTADEALLEASRRNLAAPSEQSCSATPINPHENCSITKPTANSSSLLQLSPRTLSQSSPAALPIQSDADLKCEDLKKRKKRKLSSVLRPSPLAMGAASTLQDDSTLDDCDVDALADDLKERLLLSRDQIDTRRFQSPPSYTSECSRGVLSWSPTSPILRGNPSKRFPCTECGRAFGSKFNRDHHYRVQHLGIKRFKCFRCSKSFPEKRTLNLHLLRHKGLKPYKCDLCEMRFTSKPEVPRHRRTHRYYCICCKEWLTSKKALQQHMKQMTPDQVAEQRKVQSEKQKPPPREVPLVAEIPPDLEDGNVLGEEVEAGNADLRTVSANIEVKRPPNDDVHDVPLDAPRKSARTSRYEPNTFPRQNASASNRRHTLAELPLPADLTDSSRSRSPNAFSDNAPSSSPRRAPSNSFLSRMQPSHLDTFSLDLQLPQAPLGQNVRISRKRSSTCLEPSTHVVSPFGGVSGHSIPASQSYPKSQSMVDLAGLVGGTRYTALQPVSRVEKPREAALFVQGPHRSSRRRINTVSDIAVPTSAVDGSDIPSFHYPTSFDSEASIFSPPAKREQSLFSTERVAPSFARTPVSPPLGFGFDSPYSRMSTGATFGERSFVTHSASSPQLTSVPRGRQFGLPLRNTETTEPIFSTLINPSVVTTQGQSGHLSVSQVSALRDSSSRSTSSDRQTVLEDVEQPTGFTFVRNVGESPSSLLPRRLSPPPIKDEGSPVVTRPDEPTVLSGAASGNTSYFEFPRVVCPRSKSRGDASQEHVSPRSSNAGMTSEKSYHAQPRASHSAALDHATSSPFVASRMDTPSPELERLDDIQLLPSPIVHPVSLSSHTSGTTGADRRLTSPGIDSFNSKTLNSDGRLFSLAPSPLTSNAISRPAKVDTFGARMFSPSLPGAAGLAKQGDPYDPLKTEIGGFGVDGATKKSQRQYYSSLASEKGVFGNSHNNGNRGTTSHDIASQMGAFTQMDRNPQTPEEYTSLSAPYDDSSAAGSSMSRSRSPIISQSFQIHQRSEKRAPDQGLSIGVAPALSTFDMQHHAPSSTLQPASCVSPLRNASESMLDNACRSSNMNDSSACVELCFNEDVNPEATCLDTHAPNPEDFRHGSSVPSSISSDTSSSNQSSVDHEVPSLAVAQHSHESKSCRVDNSSTPIPPQSSYNRAPFSETSHPPISRNDVSKLKDDDSSSFAIPSGAMDIELRTFRKSSSTHGSLSHSRHRSGQRSRSRVTPSQGAGIDDSDVESLGSDVSTNDFDGFFVHSISSTPRNPFY